MRASCHPRTACYASRIGSLSFCQDRGVPLATAHHDAKTLGAYFTPEVVADALVRWAVRDPGDLLLDPSSGDGRFVARHPNSVGIERDPSSVAQASAYGRRMRRSSTAISSRGRLTTTASSTVQPVILRSFGINGSTARPGRPHSTTAAAWVLSSAAYRHHGHRSSWRRPASSVRVAGSHSSYRRRSVMRPTPRR